MLFKKTKIGNMKVKNSFIKSATWEKRATESGHMTEYLYNHYVELAKGGVGTIILSYAHVLSHEKPNPNMLGIYDDSSIEEYTKLTELVHNEGTKILTQLVYGGNMTTYKVEGRDILSPSGIAIREDRPKGRPFNKEDVEELIKGFTDAAIRAKKANFDGVQIHCAHGYFFSQVISPVYNQREDEYGKNKGLLIYKVYEAMRAAVGEEYPIWIKINAKDFLPNGSEVEDTIKICKKLEKMGIDAIEVSGGHGIIADKTFARKKIFKTEDEGIFEKETIEISRALSIPVVMVGGLRSLDYINKIKETSDIRFFSLARPLIAERNLINQWEANPSKRSKCISCRRCFGEKNGKKYTCILEK